MSAFVQYLILGLGLGAAFALTAQGLVVIHRGSNVVNFANSGFGLIGAYVEYELNQGGVPTAVAVCLGLLVAAMIGFAAHYGIMRRLWTAAQLTRVIATLGMLNLVDGLGVLKIGQSDLLPAFFLPNSSVALLGTHVSAYDFWMLGIAVAVTVMLQVGYRRTTFGRLTTAIAENRRSASALGHNPDLVAGANWALGATLAAAAGILIAPVLSLSVAALSLMLVPALAAAVMGDFISFGVTLAGALLIGVAESMVQWANIGPGWPDAAPFVAVIVILLFKGTALPGRSFVQSRLPKVGSGVVRWQGLGLAVAAAVGLSAVASGNLIGAMYGTVAFGIILLSSVVVTGYAGQLSLAQLGLAGAGAFIGARVAQVAGLGFWPALVIAIAGILPIGILVGIPALRTRGVNLAIVTLGIGVIVNDVVLSNPSYAGGFGGTQVQPPSLFGLDLNAEYHPMRYFLLCLGFLLVCGLAVSSLRRSPVGRYLIAVRGNERAAASLGLNVARLKLYAFAVGAVLATIGGMLIVYEAPYANWASGWDVITGITLLGALVLAGLGYVSGAVAGGLVATSGVVVYLLSLLGTNASNWLPPILGAGLIISVIAAPDGGVPNVLKLVALRRSTDSSGDGGGRSDASAEATVNQQIAAASSEVADIKIEPLTGHKLELGGVSVQFGGVKALQDVSLAVSSGEILGLIGPNGAGKTTLIDVVTGMTRPTVGSVSLDGRDLTRLPASRRARLGLARSFQALELFEDLTVRENILVASDSIRWWGYLRALVPPKKAKLPPRARAAIKAFGLEEDLSRHPSELPYGRRRLVGIVRAIAGGATVVLLDEPAAGLDERESAELARLLRMLVETWGIGVLLVEHDMTLVMSVSDRIAALDYGEMICVGEPKEVRNDERVMRAYLGEASDDPAATESATAEVGA